MNNKQNKPKAANKSRWRNWKTIAIALYITFLLLSTIPYIADRSIEPIMKESYTYHLRYRKDGIQSHYYVERVNTSRIGIIDLTYTTASNSLDVDVQNIKVLHIYCRSMYEDECRKVYGIDPSDNSNYYKWYFIEKNHFNVNIDSDHIIQELKFIDTPLACKVVVDGVTWKEGQDYFYIDNYGNALSHVPDGHTNVDLYFKPLAGTPPIAVLSASRTIVPVNHTIEFDATQSYDLEGTITRYIIDFGDGTFESLSKPTHYYSKPGVYGVILTVRDNDNLVDHAYVNITVVKSSDIPEIQGIIPNQVKPEDSPPWNLSLNMYEPVANTPGVEFYWYITGEDNLLYSLVGENSTDDRLIFSPVRDAYGSDLVTLWLCSNENMSVSQPLWVNITPVNDPPTILPVPDLILHYDDPYTFNYEPYVNDIESPRHQLTIDIFDGYEENYITIHGLNATFTYPQELVGNIIYATVTVSDSDALAQDLFTIQVTSDHVPKLEKTLPDIWLYEGSTKYNVFDLDDYFMDPDNDAIFFSYGQTHLDISINADHTVDITAASEWTGSELVTFRARDPVGAIAEDSIIVTVLPVNDPPTIAGVPNFIIRYDHDYRFDLIPYVHDNDNATNELKIIPSDPEHIRLDIRNNLVILMNYPKEFLNQTIPVRLTVFDGIDSGFQDVTVTITEDFPPELLSPLPDIVFLEDEPLSNVFDLDNYFLDVDGDVLYYTAGNKHINITINVDHSVDVRAPKDWFGNEVVYFRATDPTGALQQDLVLVTVLPLNDPPELRNIPPQYGNESERWVLELKPYIIDVDNNISELEISIDNDFVVVSGTSLIFLGSRELPKELEIIVDDGQFTASQIIEIHLRITESPKAPTLWDLFINILPFLIIIILIIVSLTGGIYYKKSRFTAEEVFLIHQGGTLITHLSRHPQANVDDIIFSGMFTAVQDFIKDTFTQDDSEGTGESSENWALDELKLGDNNILIERSENIYLAVIFSGEGSKRLRRIVISLLDKIENRYSKILPTWDGNINQLKGTEEILSVLIKPLEKPAKDQKTSSPLMPPKDDIKPTYPLSSPKPTLAVPKPPITQAQPVKSMHIATAKPTIESKELLECTGYQTGAGLPGLLAWPMSKRKKRGKEIEIHTVSSGFGIQRFGLERLPIAYDIEPHKSRLRTVAINNRKPPATRDQPNSHRTRYSSPMGLDTKNNRDSYNIKMQDKGKKFKIDPTRSLLEQLAEMDD